MVNCLKTQLKANVQNNNLPYFGKLLVKFNGENSSAETYTIGVSTYSSLFTWASGTTGDIKIISGNATFNNGTKSARIEDSPSIIIPAGDETVILFDAPYGIVSAYFPQYLIVDTEFIKYNNITSLRFGGTSALQVEMKNIYPNITALSAANNNLKGSMKNLNFSKISNDYASAFQIGPSVEDFTLEELIALLDKGNGNCVFTNMGQTINNVGTKCTGGDVSLIGKNVTYINLARNIQNFTCSLGRRNTSDCSILGIGEGNTTWLKTPTDIDNFLINNAGCTLNDNTHTIIQLKCAESYTPSSDAQTAIATLKQKGITKVIINNTEL